MKIVGAHGLGDLIARSTPCLGEAVAAWHAEVTAARWTCDADLLARHPTAKTKDGYVQFDLGHEDHCVIARVNYGMQSVRMTYTGPRAGIPRPQRRARRTPTRP